MSRLVVLMGLVVLAAVSIAAAFTSAAAQTYPDFESQWRNPNPGDAWDPSKPAGLAQEAPLTSEYQAIFEASLKDQAAGGHGGNFHSSCMLDGMPRIMSLTAPMEILIEPKLVLFIFQDAFVRRIHTDGSPMPESVLPSFQGYSTGKWLEQDGDGRYGAPEIETQNFKGPRALDSTGLPLHRDNETVVHERIYLDKSSNDILHDDITTTDHAFTHPWTVHKAYVRERHARWGEYNCQSPPDAVFIGLEEYRLGQDKKLAPARPGQPAPDLRYFKPKQAK